MLAGRQLRLIVWIVAIVGALVGRWLGWGRVEVVGCLAVIFVLLCTTPADAIRLPRWVSELLILVGSLGLHQPATGVWIQLALVVVLLITLRVYRQSPWWAVLIGWWPIY